MPPLIAIIAELLPVAESLGQSIGRAIAAARQSGELTAEQEAAFQARLDNVFGQEYAQPRAVAVIVATPPLPV